MRGLSAKIRWSENHSMVDVPPDQLAECLETVAAKCREAGVPFIVDVVTHGYEMLLGVGLPESFVQIKSESGEPPYFITVGDPMAEGTVSFYLHGAHHTEIPRRNLISTLEAVRVARDF